MTTTKFKPGQLVRVARKFTGYNVNPLLHMRMLNPNEVFLLLSVEKHLTVMLTSTGEILTTKWYWGPFEAAVGNLNPYAEPVEVT